MTGKPFENLGELQAAVMEAVWELGQASVHQVRQHLGGSKRHAYTTVLTALQKLERAGWLKHRTEGKSYVYLPTRTREEAGAKSLQRFLKRVFDGNAVAMFQHLMQQGDLTDRELQQLRRMIDQARKERQR